MYRSADLLVEEDVLGEALNLAIGANAQLAPAPGASPAAGAPPFGAAHRHAPYLIADIQALLADLATDGEAAVRGGGVDPDAGGEEFSCLLGDIRGVQISSGAVQVTLERGQLYQFEFVDDSAKRWEDLLCLALRRFYSEEGRSVIEFKPRVVTERLPIGSDR